MQMYGVQMHFFLVGDIVTPVLCCWYPGTLLYAIIRSHSKFLVKLVYNLFIKAIQFMELFFGIRKRMHGKKSHSAFWFPLATWRSYDRPRGDDVGGHKSFCQNKFCWRSWYFWYSFDLTTPFFLDPSLCQRAYMTRFKGMVVYPRRIGPPKLNSLITSIHLSVETENPHLCNTEEWVGAHKAGHTKP